MKILITIISILLYITPGVLFVISDILNWKKNINFTLGLVVVIELLMTICLLIISYCKTKERIL